MDSGLFWTLTQTRVAIVQRQILELIFCKNLKTAHTANLLYGPSRTLSFCSLHRLLEFHSKVIINHMATS